MIPLLRLENIGDLALTLHLRCICCGIAPHFSESLATSRRLTVLQKRRRSVPASSVTRKTARGAADGLAFYRRDAHSEQAITFHRVHTALSFAGSSISPAHHLRRLGRRSRRNLLRSHRNLTTCAAPPRAPHSSTRNYQRPSLARRGASYGGSPT
jgi:hypothetical protein